MFLVLDRKTKNFCLKSGSGCRKIGSDGQLGLPFLGYDLSWRLDKTAHQATRAAVISALPKLLWLGPTPVLCH